MRIQIQELAKHNALIWLNQGDVVVDKTMPNIFLGGGVATKTTISKAVPFDLLGFMLTAEQVKRIPGSQVHMLIADQHAWLANNLDQKMARRASADLSSIARRIITTCHLTNWHIQLASSRFPNALPSSYEELETRDIKHFEQHFNCGIKIGWTFSKVAGITDESHFDKLHSLSTILIKPGLTDDPNKPHESPYICTDPTNRLVFSDNNVAVKSNAVRNHLRSICALFEHLVLHFPSKTSLETKTSWIIFQILGYTLPTR